MLNWVKHENFITSGPDHESQCLLETFFFFALVLIAFTAYSLIHISHWSFLFSHKKEKKKKIRKKPAACRNYVWCKKETFQLDFLQK